LPCQSQYSVATPDARASSVSAGEGSGLGTSSLSESSDWYAASVSRVAVHASAPPMVKMVGMTFTPLAADPHPVLSVPLLPPLPPGGTLKEVSNKTVTDWWWLIGPTLTIIGTLVGAVVLRWVLHRAIDRERDAINVYLGLAKIVTDVKAKNVLIHLASDEVGHMTKLEKHLISVLRGKDWVIERADLVEAMSAQVSQPSLIEKLDVKKLAKADTIRILGVAIDREIEANRFYLEMAGRSKKDSAKEMFLSLAKEEELHAKILRAEVDSIGQNGFWFDMQEFTMEQ